METIKVHEGLRELSYDKRYHLGHYAVDFQDGELRFELIARVCPEQGCPCDDLWIDWHTQGTVYATWLSQDGSWRDMQHQPLTEDMRAVFENVANTAMFKERYARMLYLRRRMVLERLGRCVEPFALMVTEPLLMPGADLSRGILGRFRVSSRSGNVGFCLDTCGDKQCYCDNIFLALDDGQLIATIDAEGGWAPADESPAAARLMARARAQLARDPRFDKLLHHFRTERRLEIYHRHVFADQHASVQ